MCADLKRTPEHVDLSEVRMLLRRCQYFIDRVTDTLAAASVTLPGERLTRLIDDSAASDD